MIGLKKIAIVGHFGVGKTSLMKRFVDNAFSEDYKVTLGVQIKKKTVALNTGCKLSLILWDLEGNTSLSKARRSYLVGSNAFIYVFDATRRQTYENLNTEIQFLKEHYPSTITKVIGNKSDLINKDVFTDDFIRQDLHYDYLTSAKTSENVEIMFNELAHKLILQK